MVEEHYPVYYARQYVNNAEWFVVNLTQLPNLKHSPNGKKKYPEHDHLVVKPTDLVKLTNDPKRIDAAWLSVPEGGIGIQTGINSQLAVIVMQSTAEALDSFLTLAKTYGEWPTCPRVKISGTPGGLHYYYRYTGTTDIPPQELAPGVWLYAHSHHCVIAPPSQMKGGVTATWHPAYPLGGTKQNTLPAWVLAMVHARASYPSTSRQAPSRQAAPQQATFRPSQTPSGALLFDFSFEGRSVRMVHIGDERAWHIGDACAASGIKNSRDVIRKRIENKWLRNVVISDVIGRQRKQLFTTEPGLYAIIMESHKPEARRFKFWVFEELLPSINETGQYTIPMPQQPPLALSDHLNERVQKDNSIALNSYIYRRYGRFGVRTYNSAVAEDLTDAGHDPKRWKEVGKECGLPGKECKTGLQVIRNLEPHSAAAISFEKEWLMRNHSFEKVRRHSHQVKEVYRDMIADDMIPYEVYRKLTTDEDEGERHA